MNEKVKRIRDYLNCISSTPETEENVRIRVLYKFARTLLSEIERLEGVQADQALSRKE